MGVAALRDRTGSYTAGFALLIALAFIGAVAIAMLPAGRRLDTIGVRAPSAAQSGSDDR
jgi:hypothetical protein